MKGLPSWKNKKKIFFFIFCILMEKKKATPLRNWNLLCSWVILNHPVLLGLSIKELQYPDACMHSHSIVSDSLQPMGCSPPVFSVRGIILARKLEWLTIYYSRQTSWSRGCISCDFCIDRQILYAEPPGKPIISWYCVHLHQQLMFAFLRVI